MDEGDDSYDKGQYDDSYYEGQYDDSYMEVVEKLFSVEEFYCPACQLRLFGTDEITEPLP